MIALREVTRHNLGAVLALDAGDGGLQVAPNAKSMAQAAVYGEAWPRAVCEGETAVGFVMLYDPSRVARPEEPGFFLWRLMIDQAQQRKGYGRAALQLLIEHVRTRPHGGELLSAPRAGRARPAPRGGSSRPAKPDQLETSIRSSRRRNCWRSMAARASCRPSG